MGVVTAIMAAANFTSAQQEAAAQDAQGKYKRAVGENSMKFAELNAVDALRRGDTEAHGATRKASRTIGAQKAMLAAQGIDPSFGSAGDIRAETQMLGELEATTLKNNAWREAWGYRVEGYRAMREGKYAAQAGKEKSRQTLLAGGMESVNIAAGGGRRAKSA
jgi:hypothetical protein